MIGISLISLMTAGVGCLPTLVLACALHGWAGVGALRVAVGGVSSPLSRARHGRVLLVLPGDAAALQAKVDVFAAQMEATNADVKRSMATAATTVCPEVGRGQSITFGLTLM